MFDREIRHVRALDITQTPPGCVDRVWLQLVRDGLGQPIEVPIMVARGAQPGPVLGLTAAVHGNELNGVQVIQRCFGDLDPRQMRGTVVGVLAMNVPGVLLRQRRFNDNEDLNRVAPGKPDGTDSQVYAHRFVERVLAQFDYLIDLHTASNGRVNSLYVRADMDNPITARMACLQNPQIIVHNPPSDRTFRGVAAERGIPAVTVELRDPSRFQRDTIADGLQGVRNVMYDLQIVEGEALCPMVETIQCDGSYWMYTDTGGLLTVFPKVAEAVKKGQPIAEVRTIFGERIAEYVAPEDGVVVGRSVDPINQTGSRILHLGRAPRAIPCVVS